MFSSVLAIWWQAKHDSNGGDKVKEWYSNWLLYQVLRNVGFMNLVCYAHQCLKLCVQTFHMVCMNTLWNYC